MLPDPEGAHFFEELYYPPTERGDLIDDYHGVEVADPYRWLEDLDGEKTASWVEAQNDVSHPYLEKIPTRERIKVLLTERWNYERYGIPFKRGGLYFYTRNDGLQDQRVLYIAQSLDGDPRVLIDPNTFSEDATISLASYAVSPDGKYIAYGTSDGGSDWKTWHVRDVETGDDLSDFLDYIKFTGVSWTKNGAGFYYSRYPVGDDGHGDGSAAVSVYYHAVGTEQAEDPLIYAIPEHPRRNPYASVTDDGNYLIINVSERYDVNAVYYKDLRVPDAPVVKLLDEWDAQYNFIGNVDDRFYFQTTREAPLSRVVAIDLDAPRPEDWTEIIPEKDVSLQGVSHIGERFVAQYLKDVLPLVQVFDTDGNQIREVAVPGIGSINGFGGDVDDSETFYQFTSYTDKGTIYRFDVETGETVPFTKTMEDSESTDIDPDNFETKRVFYESKDGTSIPMFITHKKGIALDGRNPTLLYGYGGFNISLTPGYSASRFVWLEMGGILAVANLRGGGEYGEDWHQAGAKHNKQNVFDDFIAAAEWLIENEYTSVPRLAIQGASNGGLLVGAVMTQRPELFGAALPAVGVLDMLRYHLPSANARAWSDDYGLSENEADFVTQYAYSPYHNVTEGACYPPTLVTTADHDDRVVPWHSFKFAAALQYGQACTNPILIRIETRAGHGAGTPTWMQIENIADQWAFLVDALEMEF